ncbi:type IV secretion system protein (plasmid) [Skermanella rosea]|uniref:type IV secretion system protein n=1 Tax=Skermanella rosea TaxID=1817965 RepID=UPI001933D6D5|nr:type IV secretion system protein [Skermanella rosea]UEM08127.1 type IV secretion system protein [Skermanella rosea]
MPLESVFASAAEAFDNSLLEGMDAAISAGLDWAMPQLRVALMLYVAGTGILMMYHKTDGWSFASAALKAMAIGALIQSTNYNYYVRDLFFTDLPNQIAFSLNGPRITVNSAQQFDVMWSAVMHFCAFILGQATGWSHIMDRALVWLFALLILLALWVCFIIWYISRVFMALVICMGAFLVILYLFRHTRGYVEQWIGKLVGLTMLQLTASILLRIILIVMNARLRAMQNDPGIGVDEMLNNMAGLTGVFWMGALLMVALPSAISIGSGVGAGAAVTAGMLGGIGAGAAGMATATVSRAARLGAALGRYTGRA